MDSSAMLTSQAAYLLICDSLQHYSGMSTEVLFGEVRKSKRRRISERLEGEGFDALVTLKGVDSNSVSFEICINNNNLHSVHFKKFTIGFYDFRGHQKFLIGDEYKRGISSPIILSQKENKCVQFELPLDDLIIDYWGKIQCHTSVFVENIPYLVYMKPIYVELSGELPD
ncbi:MAG: hypothetical protein R2795_15895 [Saprospiraceae bacterium]